MAQAMSSSAPAALTLVQERKFSASVSHVTICPKMDLLALVLDRVSVAVYRTTWQKLATIPVATEENDHITCLAWSPDGAYLAVATANAALAVYSVDRTAFAATSRAKRAAREAAAPIAAVEALPASPTCVLWAAAAGGLRGKRGPRGGEGLYGDRAAMLVDDGRTTAGLNFEGGEGGLLFVGDADGVLSVMTRDLSFTVARRRVVPSGCSVEGLHLSEELDYCLGVGYRASTDKRDGEDAEASDAECILRCVSLKHVLEYWPEIDRVGREVVALRKFVDDLTKAIAVVETAWVNGATDVLKTSIAAPLSKVMSDFAENVDRSPWAVLHDVFCGARVNGAVLQFLAAELSENGAKEALRAFRSHTDDLMETLHALLPAAENNVFRASEYSGLARLTARFVPVGVLEKDANETMKAAEDLFFAVAECLSELEKEVNRTEAFLAWLVLAAAKASGDTIQGRGPSNGGHLEGEDAELALEFFTITADTGGDVQTGKPPAGTEANLRQLQRSVDEFRDICAAASAGPCKTISAFLSVNQGILVNVQTPLEPFRRKFSFANVRNGQGNPIVLVTVVTSRGDVLCAHHGVGTTTWGLRRYTLEDAQCQIKSARPLSRQNLAFVVSSRTKESEPKVAGKNTCSRLCVRRFDPLHDAQIVSEGGDHIMSPIDAVEPTLLQEEHFDSLSVGHARMDSDPALLVDTNRLIAT